MDQITRCPLCGKQMNPVITISGCTDLQCISCDDPAAKWLKVRSLSLRCQSQQNPKNERGRQLRRPYVHVLTALDVWRNWCQIERRAQFVNLRFNVSRFIH